MREGTKPAAYHSLLPSFLPHRIIVPVYIPCLDSYFQNSLEILQLCLESLRNTVHEKASVTIVSNGCAEEVIDALWEWYRCGWFDQLLLNRCNRGKIDAVVAAARGAVESLVTISDCDVLFVPGWIEAIEDMFRFFPECGFASPAPNPRLTWYHTSATVLGSLLRAELTFKKVVPDKDLDRFAYSIGWPDLFGFDDRQSQMVVRRKEAMACVGSGHFVCTIRKEVIAAMPDKSVLTGIGGEEEFLDRPPDALGFWRLSTARAYAYHMGNVPDPWMYDELQRCRNWDRRESTSGSTIPIAKRSWTGRVPWRVRQLAAAMVKKALSHRARFRRVPDGAASPT